MGIVTETPSLAFPQTDGDPWLTLQQSAQRAVWHQATLLIVQINALCEARGLTPDDWLFRFEMPWLATAANERTAALAMPGGFPEARDRQALRLEALPQIERSDTPDLEGERLFQEGDHEGFARHVLRQLGRDE